jgi:hypothetical protein
MKLLAPPLSEWLGLRTIGTEMKNYDDDVFDQARTCLSPLRHVLVMAVILWAVIGFIWLLA